MDGNSFYCACAGCQADQNSYPPQVCNQGGFCGQNSDCAFGDVCSNSRCQQNNWNTCYNDNQCAFGEVCFNGMCQQKTWCDNDSECGWGDVCIGGQCRQNNDVCFIDSECPFSQVCMDGQCRSLDWCQSNNDCSWNQVCISNYCSVVDNGRCLNDDHCAWDLACAAEGQCRKLNWGETCSYDQQCGGDLICNSRACEFKQTTFLDSFDAPRIGYAIKGNNLARYDGVSPNECARLCLNAVQDCASFEYHPGQSVCVLSQATGPVVWASAWNLYSRRYLAPVEPVFVEPVYYSEGSS